MNALVEQKTGVVVAPADQRMAVAEVLAHAQTIQQVLAQAMKEGVDFGTIPGTDKPTLLQPGADKLAMTFRIAHEFSTEDLSTPDCARYRVKCVGRHQITGVVLGEGMGECSGAEEKYRWRRAVCDEEYDEAPANLRRIKFAKGKGGQVYKNKQVRTEPADAANTVLKMAVKRAKIAMVLNVTGASAVFGQDLEDLAPELRDAFEGRAPSGATGEVIPLTPEQLAEWEAASKKGRKAGRAFWLAWPQSARDGATDEQKQRMWAIAEAADAAPPPPAAAAPTPAPAEAPPPPPADDDFVAAMNAAEQAAAAEGAAGA